MARIKDAWKTPRPRWVAQHYRDHASQPSIFMTFRPTNPDPSLAPLPEIAIQVYSTVPLNLDSRDDSSVFCQYLSSQISDYPTRTPSFEIYSPKPDAFACVEHQRREILHRKTHRPGEYFFPVIAKVAPNNKNRLLQGFLLLITSHNFRVNARLDYKAESGPLWVTCNRSFPLRAKVDLRSRIEGFTLNGFDPSSIGDECEVFPERQELVVKKMPDNGSRLPGIIAADRPKSPRYHGIRVGLRSK